MSDVAIRVENLSKLYQLGEVGTGTLSRDIERWWATVRGKEDPFAKIGQVNDRTTKAESEFVWALKDINFEVKKGEVLGIIGRNGAGKSTLLKILSKITSPTKGKIYLDGRIASLLEVGTGFHPEMTGRENIYMNGAILGMRKKEIQQKFDAIVDFAGVEKYIDTPVKRYSSGMYVRLAFAVAAYLEPEILIVDEVLAVGDAEFQKKCLGRMKDVSVNEGRTVLFVSHNMGAVSQICNSGCLLSNGTIQMKGGVENIIERYLTNDTESNSYIASNTLNISGKIQLQSLKLFDKENKEVYIFSNSEPVIIKLDFLLKNVSKRYLVLLTILDKNKNTIFSAEHLINAEELRLQIEPKFLARGNYSCRVIIYIPGNEVAENLFDIGKFTVIDGGTEFAKLETFDYGVVFGNYKWL